MSSRLLGILPGLLLAGAVAGRNMGMFGGNQQALAAGLSQKDLDGNNAVWSHLGQGQIANGQQPPAGAPTQLPGADLTQQAQRQQQEAQRRAIANTLPQPNMGYAMPNGLAGGQTPPLLAGAGASMPPMMTQHWSFPNSMSAYMHGQPQPDVAFSTDRQRAPIPMFASLQQRGLI
jgi:hypothetical protein